MPVRHVTVGSAVGLHARPAALIAARAGEYDEEITLRAHDKAPVDASSALLIMSIGAQQGDAVEVASDNPAAVEAIADLVAEDLDG